MTASPSTLQKRRCLALNRAGHSCGAPATTPRGYCVAHDPRVQAEARVLERQQTAVQAAFASERAR